MADRVEIQGTTYFRKPNGKWYTKEFDANKNANVDVQITDPLLLQDLNSQRVNSPRQETQVVPREVQPVQPAVVPAPTPVAPPAPSAASPTPPTTVNPTLSFTTARGISTYEKVGKQWYWNDNGTLKPLSKNPDSPSPNNLNAALSVKLSSPRLPTATTATVTLTGDNRGELGSARTPANVPDPAETISSPSVNNSERLYENLSNDELKDFAGEYTEALDRFNAENREAINNGTLSPEQKAEWEELQYARQGLLNEIESRELLKDKPDCFKKESDNSYSFTDTPDCEKFIKSVLGNNLAALSAKTYSLPNPCGTSEYAKINVELHKFFITLKGIKKYGQLYINGAINKTRNLTNLIRNASTIIAAVLKSLVQRFRDFILEVIRDAIESVVDNLFTNLAKNIKDSVVQQIVDEIFCKFKDIIGGLKDLVVDFLFELIGKIANAPFCLVQQFTDSLMNNLAAQVDAAIGPVLDQISDVLGGISKFAGQVFQAIDYIVGFQSFLCAKPNCPEINEYAAGPWGGPNPSNPNPVEAFLSSPDLDAGEAIDFLNEGLDNLLGTGGGLDSDRGPIPSSVTDCSTDPFKCGPPTVEFFGGGGAGAVGSAVVDTAGRILGVDLVFGGTNYSRPPFVTFMDSCGSGNYASAYTEINEEGQITNVVMVENGSGYLNSPTGLTEFDDDPDFTFNDPVQEEKVTDYVVCLDELQIISTGIGYSIEDQITITPDIPNLKAQVKMTEIGQIVAIELLEKPCNLTTVPTITINSLTGGGLEVRPRMTFTRIEEFNALADAPSLQNIVRVVDCIS